MVAEHEQPVRLLLAHVHLLDAVAEDGRVELLGGRHIARLALVPLERPRLVRELRAVMGARLPDAEDRSGRILRDRHPAGIEDVERIHQHGAARVPDLRRGVVDVVARDVGRPVRRDPSCCGGLAAATYFPRSVNIV